MNRRSVLIILLLSLVTVPILRTAAQESRPKQEQKTQPEQRRLAEQEEPDPPELPEELPIIIKDTERWSENRPLPKEVCVFTDANSPLSETQATYQIISALTKDWPVPMTVRFEGRVKLPAKIERPTRTEGEDLAAICMHRGIRVIVSGQDATKALEWKGFLFFYRHGDLAKTYNPIRVSAIFRLEDNEKLMDCILHEIGHQVIATQYPGGRRHSLNSTSRMYSQWQPGQHWTEEDIRLIRKRFEPLAP